MTGDASTGTAGAAAGTADASGGTPASAPPPPGSDGATGAAGAATPGAAGAGAGMTCDNCGVERRPDDVFCESCGYDFASGSLPESAPAAGTAGVATTGAAATPVHVKVQVDATFFEASVGQVDLQLPDPIPDVSMIPLAGIRILIGRRSTSRGVFPEVDVLALTGDPAVSSRHALLERSPDNSWTLTDLGSTNGTFLRADATGALTPGVATPVVVGTSIYLGAWTRIDLGATV